MSSAKKNKLSSMDEILAFDEKIECSKAGFETFSFEAALGELEQLVERVEQTPGSLDETIGAYERGMQLVGLCRQSLQDAESKLKVYEQQNNQFKELDLDSKLKSS